MNKHRHMPSAELAAKRERLQQILRDTGGCAVAFSGGVDSTLLLAEAVEALGDRVLALTAFSLNHARWERREAEETARWLGVRQRLVEGRELENPAFVANPPERCYLCKKALFTELDRIAREEGFSCLADGTNVDDQGDFRPGRRALRELGVRSPLREAGLTKAEVRTLSSARGLSTWDKPAYACLSTRIPYGTTITRETLERIERAEDGLLELGLRVIRVRHHGEVARLELGPEEYARVVGELREEVCRRVRQAGYHYVAVDLEGYRTGALNEVLSAESKAEAR